MYTTQVNGGEEQMKSNLLDLVAPQLLAPLTSIKASVSALLTDSRLEPSRCKDLLVVVAEKANHLSGMLGEALDTWDAEARRQILQKSNRRPCAFGSTKARPATPPRGCQSRSKHSGSGRSQRLREPEWDSRFRTQPLPQIAAPSP